MSFRLFPGGSAAAVAGHVLPADGHSRAAVDAHLASLEGFVAAVFTVFGKSCPLPSAKKRIVPPAHRQFDFSRRCALETRSAAPDGMWWGGTCSYWAVN